MRRKFISLTLVLCILLSCFAIGGISASAATATDEVGTISGGQTIYFTPSNNWKQDGARFALYYFNDSTGTNGWVSGTTESNTIYKMTIPSGTWTGIIFVRMNPSSSQNNWNNKWNQTADITSIPSGKNHYFLNEGWDNPSGYWGTHTPATQPTTAAPTTVQPTTVQPTTTVPTTVAPTTENTGLGSYTVYFIDTQNWGTPNLYFWNAGPSWPGTEMTQTGVDSNGKKIYSMTIPSETVGIVFNANGNQTVDITTNICDGATWYATGAKDGSKFVVDYIAPQEPTTEPTTAAPQYTQTVYFKPNAEWRSNNAVFAINVWGKSRWTEAWVQLNPIGNGYYYAELPGIAEGYNIAVAWESCQFARFSYGTTSFSADNALCVSTSRVFYNGQLYTLDDIMMDNATGNWSVYQGNAVVPDTTGNTSTVYFKPGSDWEKDNAKFAVYVWGKGSWATAWVELDYLADGIYYAKLPSLDEEHHIGVAWESCQFARFSPETTQYSSSNAWNISMAKVFERGKLFTLNAGEWNNAGGTWSTYGEQPTTVAPTTVEPTTAAPTEPATTVEPTTAPSTDVVDRDGILVVADNFNLILNAAGTKSVANEIYLAAGQYKFKVQKDRVLYGYNKTVNDATTGGLSVKSTYNSQITLNATGGVYKFVFNKNTNALTIAKANDTPATYLVGDIHTILKPVSGNQTVAIGSMYIPAGSYDFKVSLNGAACGYNKTVNDTTNGGSISTNPNYSASIKLVATGGMYTFTLNKSTRKLIIGYTNDANESKTDVHVTGDLDLVLNDNGGENDIATATKTLEAGTYTFKVYNYGVVYTIGGTIKDSGTKGLKTSYMSPVTLNATGGTYTFQFNKKNGYLTVSK